MHAWSVILSQPTTNGERTHAAVVMALDANDAARQAQKVLPGWTAVFIVRRP